MFLPRSNAGLALPADIARATFTMVKRDLIEEIASHVPSEVHASLDSCAAQCSIRQLQLCWCHLSHLSAGSDSRHQQTV